MIFTRYGDQKAIDYLRILRLLCHCLYVLIFIRDYFLNIIGKFNKFSFEKIIEMKDGEDWVVLAIFEQRSDILHLINDLKISGYKVFVVLNRNDVVPDPDLLSISDILMSRKNSGRDFGAYAAASKFIYALPIKINKILFINDSSYYIRKSTDIFCQIRFSNEDLVSLTATETKDDFFTHGNFFQINGEVFYKHKVRNFFHNYININSPRYAVTYGEKKSVES